MGYALNTLDADSLTVTQMSTSFYRSYCNSSSPAIIKNLKLLEVLRGLSVDVATPNLAFIFKAGRAKCRTS